MSNGTVYVFNCTPATMNLTLNAGFPAGAAVPGIVQTNGYAPNSTSVPRSPDQNPQAAMFGSSSKLVTILGGTDTYQYEVEPGVATSADLQLYVFYGSAVLVIPSGTESPVTVQTLKGEMLS